MKRKALYGFLSLLLIFNFVVGVKVFTSRAAADSDDAGYENLTVFTRALQLIRQDYVDANKIGYRDLTYSALRGMLGSLDPHSQFMEPTDFREMQNETRSEFGGLGIVVSTKDGVLTVVSPMEDSPGFRAGISPGDQILRINGTTTEKMSLQDAINLLRGDPGQKATLTIFRPSTKETRDYPLQREVIKVASVKDAKILDQSITGNFKIGYVRITQFNEPTAQELDQKLNELQAQGMQALIVDLRYNPGGLLVSAVDVCGLFLPPRTMVVYTEGRDASQRREYFTSKNEKQRPNFPVVLLVNNGSASGSEIVAGALKDLNRAILVGDTTFGKGSVQSVIQLPDGAALRLTTAKYYTPSKQVIHEKGITPNIKASLTADQERALLLRHRDGLLSSDEQKFVDDQKDPQLDRALDALKGAMIYNQNDKHTMLVRSTGIGAYHLLGRTLDDAAGEAFDKVAKLLELPYPGGPEIDRLARQGNPKKFDLPRSMVKSGDFNFSFSGLKTAVRYLLPKLEGDFHADVCASFQEAVVDVLVQKTIRAAERSGVQLVTVSGGVSANSRLRSKMLDATTSARLDLKLASPSLSTDNAAMIAYAALERYQLGYRTDLREDADPNLQLV
jgi:carboxyl-terminal processing protease